MIVGHVRFVFLNDNDDAFFKHGEEQVPVVAGNLVTFPGDVPHSTIVNSDEVYLLGPFDERFNPIAGYIKVMHVTQEKNRFIRQRRLDDAVAGDGITFESTNSTNITDECSLLDVLDDLQDSLANPNIIELEEVPDGVVVYEYQRTVIIDGVVVMGFYVDITIDGE
jgi:hypothetical protein